LLGNFQLTFSHDSGGIQINIVCYLAGNHIYAIIHD